MSDSKTGSARARKRPDSLSDDAIRSLQSAMQRLLEEDRTEEASVVLSEGIRSMATPDDVERIIESLLEDFQDAVRSERIVLLESGAALAYEAAPEDRIELLRLGALVASTPTPLLRNPNIETALLAARLESRESVRASTSRNLLRPFARGAAAGRGAVALYRLAALATGAGPAATVASALSGVLIPVAGALASVGLFGDLEEMAEAEVSEQPGFDPSKPEDLGNDYFAWRRRIEALRPARPPETLILDIERASRELGAADRRPAAEALSALARGIEARVDPIPLVRVARLREAPATNDALLQETIKRAIEDGQFAERTSEPVRSRRSDSSLFLDLVLASSARQRREPQRSELSPEDYELLEAVLREHLEESEISNERVRGVLESSGYFRDPPEPSKPAHFDRGPPGADSDLPPSAPPAAPPADPPAPPTPGSGDAPEPPPDGPTSTRYLEASLPARCIVGDPVHLAIGVRRVPKDKSSSAAVDMPEIPETGLSGWIRIDAPGFDVLGQRDIAILIERDRDLDLQIGLRPRAIGELVLNVELLLGSELKTAQQAALLRRSTKVYSPESGFSVDQKEEGTCSIRVPSGSARSGREILLISVNRAKHSGELFFEWTFPDGDYDKKNYTPPAGKDGRAKGPRDVLQSCLDTVNESAKSDGTSEIEQDEVMGLGLELWRDYLPDEVLEVLMMAVSQEWQLLIRPAAGELFPWELLFLEEPKDYLGMIIPITRATFRKEPTVSFRTPRFAQTKVGNLAGPAAEIDWLKTFLEGQGASPRSEDPIRSAADLKRAFLDGQFDILHLAGHHEKSGKIVYPMEDYGVSPKKLRAWKVQRQQREGIHPMFFLNACGTGESTWGAVRLEDWASELESLNPAAVVGTLWNVRDSTATHFAKRFYTRFVERKLNLSESILLARQDARGVSPVDSSWLAYIVYGDPNAKAS